MKVLIVCHAGAGVGLGHLTRSLVVARSLRQELAADVSLLIQGDPVQRADLDEFVHGFLNADQDLLTAVRLWSDSVAAQLVVFDLCPRLIPVEIDGLFQALRTSGCKLVGIDGLLPYRNALDLVLMPTFKSPPPSDSGAMVLSGWDCFLLNVRGFSGQWLPGREILVLTGGSDATGLGRSFPKLLNAALPDGARVHWVTGPYANAPSLPPSARIEIIEHRAPASLDELMLLTNYAVTVYGVSFYELLHYGVPTVVFSPYGNKDDSELAEIAAESLALVADDEQDALQRLQELMADQPLAVEISQRAKQKLSVSGGQRLARAVAELFA